MIGKTLALYLAKTFLRNIVMVFVLFFALIIVVDLIELSRELSNTPGVQFSNILAISLFRAPEFAGHVIPFAVLFGASGSLLMLNKRLELVVARSAGVSVWQFLWPMIVVALLIGTISAAIYNPLSIAGKAASISEELEAFGKAKGAFSNQTNNFWLRTSQGKGKGDVIFRARVAEKGGAKLAAVNVYLFDTNGKVVERVDAATAQHQVKDGQSRYVLNDAITFETGKVGLRESSKNIAVTLSATQLRQQTIDADEVQFWGLEEARETAALAGKNSLPFATQYYALLGQPLLFVSMVLLAATFSLTFARFGQNEKLILAGVLAGFVLYIGSKLVVTFGSNGLVSPLIAAWTPALVAALVGTTVLLHQEDG